MQLTTSEISAAARRTQLQPQNLGLEPTQIQQIHSQDNMAEGEIECSGKRIKRLVLYREINSDSWLPTRGILSREHWPFFLLYAWALYMVSMKLYERALTERLFL